MSAWLGILSRPDLGTDYQIVPLLCIHELVCTHDIEERDEKFELYTVLVAL